MELLSTGVEDRNKGSGRKEEGGVGEMLGAYNVKVLHRRAFFRITEELLMYSLSEKLIINLWGVCLSYKLQTTFPSMNMPPIFTHSEEC